MSIRKWGLCIIACIVCGMVQAEVLKGRVVDAETQEPLGGAKVTVEDVIPDLCMSRCTLETDSSGYFRYATNVGNIVTIKAKFLGYHDKTIKRIGIGGNDTIYLDDIKLKPSAELMKELVVGAKVKRFYMKGDTVVFNPEAFNLEEGDRLIRLVEKLPGVNIKDGRLLWNGEPLKVMMNGKDAMNQGMLLEQLPMEAVEKVKAYDRTSELQDRTGVADGNQEHVLDVVVKPGFMEKFLTEVEAKAYAGKEYAAKASATKLSDHNPVMIYVRVADDPEKVSLMTMGAQGWASDIVPIRQQMGALAYRHNWQPGYEVKRDSWWDVTAGINHADQTNEKWENVQVFMPETAPTLSKGNSCDRNHNLTVPLDFSSFLNIGQYNTLRVTANVSYVRELDKNNSEQETVEAEDWLAKVNSSEYQSREERERFSTNGSACLTHYFSSGSLSADVAVTYDNTKSEGTSMAEYRYFQSGETITDMQCFSAPSHRFSVQWGMNVNKSIGKDIMAHAGWSTLYVNNFRDEQRWRNDAADKENSIYRKDNNWITTFSTDANCKFGAFTVKPSLELKHQHDQTAYRRAALDTLAGRNMLLVRPMVELHYRFKGQMSLKGKLGYNNMPADMIDCLGYTDNTNPLHILMGNPNLKTSHTLDASLLYNMMIAKHCQSVSALVDYQKVYDPIGTVMHYNSQTGGYRVQKKNVRGGNRWKARVAYERDLTDDLHLGNTLQGEYTRSYGIMTMVDDATGVSYNRQNETLLKNGLKLTYEHGPWYVHTKHMFQWMHYGYSDEAQLVRDLFEYSAELRGTYKLKRWKFIIGPRYILDRGYSSDAMNGGQFLLNAQVNFTFLKNRAELQLYATDLLNQRKWHYSDITATSHSETWEKGMRRYVSLTFKYRFDPKSKKE